MRAFLLTTLLATPTIAACTDPSGIQDGGADLAGQNGKGDAIPGIDVQARLRPGTIDSAITAVVSRPGFVFYAADDARVTLEVTHGGTAIDGVVDFTAKVHQLGGKVVLVTNRMAMTECPQTEDNLHAVGVTYDGIVCKTTTSDKNPRFDAVKNGTAVSGLPALEIVGYVGDNILDFPALTQDLREQPISAFGDFGDKLFLLPNPMYGSWQGNPD